jgi:hypothetical protein
MPETVDLLSDSESESVRLGKLRGAARCCLMPCFALSNITHCSISQSPAPKVSTASYSEYGAFRIAVGMKVFFADCNIGFHDTGHLDLSFRQSQRDTRRSGRRASTKVGDEEASGKHAELRIDLKSHLTELKYFIAGDATGSDAEDATTTAKGDSDDATEQMRFLALKIDRTKENGLENYPNQYKSHGKATEKQYVLLEFRSDKDCQDLLETMKSTNGLSAFVTDEAQLDANQAQYFSVPFVKDSAQAKRIRLRGMGSPTSRKKEGFLAGKQDTDTLLVYPFAGDPEDMENAARGLNEPNGRCFDTDPMDIEAEDVSATSREMTSEGKTGNAATEIETTTRGRTHFLTIRVEEYEHLEPGEFLNDTLINFWMRW